MYNACSIVGVYELAGINIGAPCWLTHQAAPASSNNIVNRIARVLRRGKRAFAHARGIHAFCVRIMSPAIYAHANPRHCGTSERRNARHNRHLARMKL